MMTARFYMCEKVILQGVGAGVNDTEREGSFNAHRQFWLQDFRFLKKLSGEKARLIENVFCK